MVIHWKTVSIAKPILSKPTIPHLGPSQYSLHSDTLDGQENPPEVELFLIVVTEQGVSSGSPARSHSPWQTAQVNVKVNHTCFAAAVEQQTLTKSSAVTAIADSTAYDSIKSNQIKSDYSPKMPRVE